MILIKIILIKNKCVLAVMIEEGAGLRVKGYYQPKLCDSTMDVKKKNNYMMWGCVIFVLQWDIEIHNVVFAPTTGSKQ